MDGRRDSTRASTPVARTGRRQSARLQDAVRLCVRVTASTASAATKRVTRPATPADRRHRRDLPAVRPGERSRRPLPDRGGHQLRHRPASATAPARASATAAAGVVCQDGLHRVRCSRRTATATATGTCSGAAAQSCAPFQCATRRPACRTTCTIGRRLRRRPTAASTAAAARSRSAPPAAPTPTAIRPSARRAVCCSTACTGTCKSCAVAGQRGTCRNVPDGQDPLGQCADAGAADLRDGRSLRRHGRLPQVRGRHRRAATDICSGRHRDGRRAVRRRRDAARRDAAPCSPYVCGTTALPDQVRDQRRLRGRLTSASGTICGKKSNGIDLRRGVGVQVELLRAGRLLQHRLRGHLQGAATSRAPSGPAPPVPAGKPPVVASQCADDGRHVCGTDGTCNGAGACRQLRRGHRSAVAASCTGSTLSSPRTCDGAGVCRPPTIELCAPYHLRHRRLQDDLPPAAADCVSPQQLREP